LAWPGVGHGQAIGCPLASKLQFQVNFKFEVQSQFPFLINSPQKLDGHWMANGWQWAGQPRVIHTMASLRPITWSEKTLKICENLRKTSTSVKFNCKFKGTTQEHDERHMASQWQSNG